MAACHLRKRTLEVAESNVNDEAQQEVRVSAIVEGKDTQSTAVVPNNDDSRLSAHIQNRFLSKESVTHKSKDLSIQQCGFASFELCSARYTTTTSNVRTRSN